MTDTTSNTRSEGEQTAATIDATASAWGLPAAGETIFDFDYTSGRDQLLRLYDKGTRRQWVASDRIDWNVDVDFENPLGVPDESVMLVRYAVLGEDERPRARRGSPPPGRVAVLAVPARRAGRARCARRRS